MHNAWGRTALTRASKLLTVGAAALAFSLFAPGGTGAAELVVGSKRFTESYIVGEIVARVARAAGEADVTFKPGLGNTAVVFAALKSGAIDIYPEYSGTIAYELLGGRSGYSLDDINRALAPSRLAAGVPLGFSNTYALAMMSATAHRLGIGRISDLAAHPDLKFGLSQEFLSRQDGWPALKQTYLFMLN